MLTGTVTVFPHGALSASVLCSSNDVWPLEKPKVSVMVEGGAAGRFKA